MRLAQMCLALLLGLPLAAGAAAPITSLDFDGSAWVDVDATGKAHVVEMGKLSKLGDVPELASITDRINGKLRDAIERWQFVPATLDGAAVPTHTRVVVEMEGTDDGAGGMAVRIRSAQTGPGIRYLDMRPLTAAVTLGQTEGLVELKLAYDPDGNVSAAEVADSKEFWHGAFSGKADKDLRKSAVAAARHWRLEPEVVGGHPRPGSGKIILLFCLTTDCLAAPLPGDHPNGPQQFAATDPAVRLLSNVAGTAL